MRRNEHIWKTIRNTMNCSMKQNGRFYINVNAVEILWLINSRDGEPMKEPKRPVLAHGKVRHVGDAYAAVVAETEEIGERGLNQ